MFHRDRIPPTGCQMWICPEIGHTVLPYSKSDGEARAIWHVNLAEPGKMG